MRIFERRALKTADAREAAKASPGADAPPLDGAQAVRAAGPDAERRHARRPGSRAGAPSSADGRLPRG